MESPITKEQAIKLFEAHAAHLNEVWCSSPEGKKYNDKFLEAIEVLRDK